MADELTKKLEDLTEADLKKVVGGESSGDGEQLYCDKCKMYTQHINGECIPCQTHLAGH